jgi:hypothetical protein
MKVKFETIEQMCVWMDRAANNVLKDRTCEVNFVHRGGCPHIIGTQKSGADQTCACRPRPVLSWQ